MIKLGGYKWAEEELELLNNMYGSASISSIKGALNKVSGRSRTYEAIRKKALKEGLQTCKNTREYMTAEDIAEAMGYAKCTVLGLWKRWGLKIDMVVFANKKKVSKITAKNFWKFAYDNRHKLSFEHYKEGSILPEPTWLREELSKKQKRFKRELTIAEEAKVISLRKMGYKNNEIAESINASTNEMDAIIRALLKNGKIESRGVGVPFSTKELKLIKEYRENGQLLKEIAYEVGRDMKTISKKIRELKKNGEWEKIG